MQKRTQKFLAQSSAIVCLLGIGHVASAHPGHDVSGLAAGLAHPFSGPDHLLAMIAVGIWAAECGGRKVWLLPATFMAALAAGAALATDWQGLPLVEAGIAGSVLALGLLTALSLKFSTPICISITALFGLMHGYAHGLELPESAAPAAYASGFLAATAVLHVTGIAIAFTVSQRFPLIRKLLGSMIAVSGAYLLFAS
jgi:urease accessory protein